MTIEQQPSDQLPIDAVITWVDGSDPKHKATLDAYLASIGGARPRAASSARFNSVGEIEYCVVSLLRFAPWVRTIFIVSDQQQPEFISKLAGTAYASRIKVVDHSVIFAGYEQYLPTFNSMSISDFFRGNKVVLHGVWRAQTDWRFVKRISNLVKKVLWQSKKNEKDERVRFIGVQENGANMFGFNRKVFQLEHNPHPWKQSSWQQYFSASPAELDKNISFKLRSAQQFVPESFSAHYEIKTGNAVIDNSIKTLQLKPADQAMFRLKSKLSLAECDTSYAFVCVQSLENASKETFSLIINWLDSKIGRFEQLLKKENNKNS